MAKHATLSASSAERWLHCPPSARLNEKVADFASEYAREGSEAHALCEFRLKLALGKETENPIPDLSMYSQEMEDAVEQYVARILECLEAVRKTTPDPVVLIEQRLDFSDYVPGGFGTADCVILADRTLHLFDMKYGTGVLVNAKENPQLMLYALGCLQLFDVIYDFDEVTMTIIQPRRDNYSTFNICKDVLYKWANETVKPIATLAFDGKGEFSAGDWCRFCKVKATCTKRSEVNLELAKLEFARPPLLSDTEIEEILGKLDELTSWASDIKSHALAAARSGKKWRGFKLVEGRSNRRYLDDIKVAKAVEEIGFYPYEKRLLGITDMTALLGKKRFNEILQDLIIKPQGKPTLVPDSDKRPEMTNIFDDFKEDNINV